MGNNLYFAEFVNSGQQQKGFRQQKQQNKKGGKTTKQANVVKPRQMNASRKSN